MKLRYGWFWFHTIYRTGDLVPGPVLKKYDSSSENEIPFEFGSY
jgi:hypothetical protein